MPATWFVWAEGRGRGVFQSSAEAIAGCKRVANDHRRKIELTTLSDNLLRYVGPRGRRHGTRLVAYIGTAEAFDSFATPVATLDDRTWGAAR